MLADPTIVKLSVIEDSSLERDEMVTRKITSIFGMPFYQSSGINSDFSNTWFPFHGLLANGVYIKREFEDQKFPLPPEFRKIFMPASCYDKRTAGLGARFGSLGGLLISSCLGGGLWESIQGNNLLTILKKKYSAFYDAWPLLVLENAELNVHDIQVINEWLLSKVAGNDMKDLWLIFPKTLDAIIEMPFQEKGQENNHKTEQTHQVPDKKRCIIC